VKVNGEGQRTDLVTQDLLDEGLYEKITRVAEGLAVTEWRVVKREKELNAKLESAYTQIERYSEGVLYGFELSSVRYVVLVSEKGIKNMPKDKLFKDYKVRHVNIVIHPETPSKP
jgi:hypothetical protein